ncbi:MAG: double-strand break repair helicase AddA [Reyranellaceae bacterium]
MARRQQRERERAGAAQRPAIDPQVSAWVTANAGTGKTKVLTDRLLRLLLSGTPPSKILCLTFTKAAAAEMRNRLAAALGRWSRLDEAALRVELGKIVPAAITRDALARARGLFARVLDEPGGIYIVTLHAFCQAVLQRFPLEAQVPPHFQVLDEAQAADLLLAARDQVLERAETEPALAQALRVVAARVDGTRFADLLQAVLSRRTALQAVLAQPGGERQYLARLAKLFGLKPGESEAAILAEMGNPPPALEQRLRACCAALARGAKTDQGRGQAIAELLAAGADREGLLAAYCNQFLTQKGEPRASLATKAIGDDIRRTLAEEAERLCALQRKRLSAGVVERSTALLKLAFAVIGAFERAKQQRAALDYDDLIERTRALLDQSGAPGWVLYKLDGGFDHVLIDEAQDTSPQQWDVVRRLTGEFFAGAAAQPQKRTLFVVGDLKQSIYSFQGADPAKFVEMHRFFRDRIQEAHEDFEDVPLIASFRSTAAVLQAVDLVFAAGSARDGVAEDEDNAIEHRAVRLGEAGRVELWPLVEPLPDEKPDPWQDPAEQEGALPPQRRLARLIAAHIRHQIDRDELPSQNRRVAARDIMVLVQRRNAFVEALVRELKERGVGVAGIDRLKLTSHIAVMDLMAIGQAALLPGDDLTLATVLKGPLVGLSEEALFTLCWQRPGSVFQALRARADAGEEPFAGAWRVLAAVFARADFMPPFEFYGELLGRDGGRLKLLQRLGPEAADPIDEFLGLALSYQRGSAPSLQAFLHWLQAGEPVVKRELEQSARDEVRIMTVHGAKGLQAPIVYLPDTTFNPLQRSEPLVPGGKSEDALLVWRAAQADSDQTADRLHEDRQQSRRRENNRLLYVAMTRAADRLVICGARGKREIPDNCWYAMVRRALESAAGDGGAVARLPFTLGEQLAGDPQITGDLLRLESDDLLRPEPGEAGAQSRLEPLPDWAHRPPLPEEIPPRPLAPSRGPEDDSADAGEPAALSPLQPDDRQRFARGLILHRLLQYLPDLPPERRHAAASRYLAQEALRLDAPTQAQWREELLAVMEAPAHAALFGPGSRAEVPLTGIVEGKAGPYVVSGQVDRLVVGERIAVIDYKTNRPPPTRVEDVAPLYLRQMAAYRALLRQIWPGKPIDCLLLWTDGARLMALPPALLDAHSP